MPVAVRSALSARAAGSAAARIALLLACLALPARVGAEIPVDGFDSVPELHGLEARWSEIMDLFDTPGMAVAVVRGDSIHVATLGIRDPESLAPVTRDTEFYIASITKTYTAAGIRALAADSKLRLDEPVHELLPRLSLPDSDVVQRLTADDLLCHRYGIDSGPAVILDAYTGEITEDRYYHWLAQASVAGQIRYSNVHFTLLGRVIEAVTGESWRDYLEARLFQPAGMTRTTGYASRMWADPDHAVPSVRAGEGFRALSLRKTDRTMHAAGGLGTTAVDGGRWLLLFLDHGTIDGKQVLPPDVADDMLTVHARLDQPDGTIRVIEGFGSAWQVGTFNGHRLAMHSGGYTGAAAHCAILPDDGIGVFVLANTGGPAQALTTIAAIDVLERLTGTTSPWSVYDTYVAHAKEVKAAAAESGGDSGGESPPLPLEAVTRPVGLYEGEFHNPWWGTIAVTQEDGGFRIRLGDLDISNGGVEGEKNTFPAGVAFSDDAVGRFIVEPNGTVERIVVRDPTYGEIEFRR